MFAGSCHKFYAEARNRTAANLRCKEDGSQLASIHSSELQDFLVGLMDE